MYTVLCSSLLFPLHERIKGHHSVALLREIEESQWWPDERLIAAQVERLRGFMVQAGRDVPYYRDLFARTRFDPSGVQSVTDLQALPFLDKPTIRAAGDRLKSERAGKLIKYNTGGSSGEPLVFYMGMGRVSHDVAAKWRATRWWGVDIGDVEVVLWGSPIEIGKQDRIKGLRDRLFRSHLLPAFQMSDAQMDRYLDEIARLRPKMLFGYASALALLAAHAERRGRDIVAAGRAWRSRRARPFIRRNARSSSESSAPRSRMGTVRVMRASLRTSVPRARCTYRRSTSWSNWWTQMVARSRRASRARLSQLTWPRAIFRSSDTARATWP